MQVMIWDDHQSRCIGELSFRSEVRAVRLRRDRVVVTLEHKVYVYNFSDLKLLHQIETIANPTGLGALSPNSAQTVLACPGLHKGEVHAPSAPSSPRRVHMDEQDYSQLAYPSEPPCDPPRGG